MVTGIRPDRGHGPPHRRRGHRRRHRVRPAVAVFVGSQTSSRSRSARSTTSASSTPTSSASEYMEQDDGGDFCVSDGDTVVLHGDAGVAAGLVLYGDRHRPLRHPPGHHRWTLGKLLTGIRVVDEHGSRPASGASSCAGCCGSWTASPSFGLVAFITGLTTIGHRRVGDMVAKTYVVAKAAAVGQPGSCRRPPPRSPGPPTPVPRRQRPARARSGTRRAAPTSSGTPQAQAWMQWDDAAKRVGPDPAAAPAIPPPPPPPRRRPPPASAVAVSRGRGRRSSAGGARGGARARAPPGARPRWWPASCPR